MPSKQLTIRRAKQDDADALADCIDAAYARYQGQITDLPPLSEGCAEEITTNQVWVAVRDGAIIGGLVLAVRDDVLKLANLAVHPEHGGQGIGRKLIELALSEARARGFDELHLMQRCLIISRFISGLVGSKRHVTATRFPCASGFRLGR